ncbi:MAG: alpha-ketoglutarate-dependent dioxygenase AlkB [Armatimonas sp.]
MDAPNVLYIPDFLPEPNLLLSRFLETVTTWDTRIQARRTASFGVPYNYSGMEYEQVPIPTLLEPVIEKLHALLGFAPNNCLANYYQDGTSRMGFHKDDTAGLEPGTGVAILSLGAERTLWFRLADHRSHRVGYPLVSGSLLYMPPEVQDHWQHGVPRDENVTTERVSLTFRCCTPPRIATGGAFEKPEGRG